MSITMKDFINAYIAVYGGSIEYATRVWRATNTEYHKAVIESFKHDAHAGFYED